jgi:transposase
VRFYLTPDTKKPDHELSGSLAKGSVSKSIVNADCGQILGIVGGWLTARSQAWRSRIEVVAIDPSAAFKKAITNELPNAKISVDPFHLVQLANLMVTRV